jgi:hypothetical protein
VAFRWLCSIEKQSVTNAVSANSLRFAQICFFAMCLFYEDDNETYAYERGGYSAIQMKWDNKHQTFTLFAPIGKMPPKLENRKFKIQIFTPLESGHVSVIEKDIIYNNKTMKLKF